MAINDHSTQATRRGLFGAPGAMLLLAAPAAGASKAAELDSDLLAACAVFHAAEANVQAVPGDHEHEDELTEKLDAWCLALAAVGDLTPRTSEGLHAKARVAYVALLDQVNGCPQATIADDASLEERVAILVLRDVMGRAGA